MPAGTVHDTRPVREEGRHHHGLRARFRDAASGHLFAARAEPERETGPAEARAFEEPPHLPPRRRGADAHARRQERQTESRGVDGIRQQEHHRRRGRTRGRSSLVHGHAYDGRSRLRPVVPPEGGQSVLPQPFLPQHQLGALSALPAHLAREYRGPGGRIPRLRPAVHRGDAGGGVLRCLL
ncbi:MAG: hypothetical protein WC483_03885 [Candidatus Paceibacterota bacterium]